MLPVFTVVPPIRPGQTLKSHLALVSHLNLASPRTISQRIFGAPWRDADWLVPGNLLLYAKSIGGPLGSPDPEYWLAHHTLVPLFAATLDEARVIQWKRRILGANFGPRRPYMTGSLEEWLVPQVKLCRACDDQNMERFGYSMVHREWMAPFATRCHHHHEALTVHSAWGPHARGAGSELPLMPARAAQGVLLAEKVEETLLVSQGLMQELLELLRQHDFLLPSGRFRRQALAALVQRACPSLCEHAELSAMFSDANSVERLLGPIGRDKGTLHTPVAVVLVEALRDASEQSPGRASAANTKKQPSSAKGLLAVNADSLQSTASEIAQVHGVCVTTAVTHALANGVPVALRPKVLKPDLRMTVESLLLQGVAVAEIAEQTKLSLCSVYRVLKANPPLAALRARLLAERELNRRQAQWTAVVKANPKLGPKALRALAPAAFAYLHRHDHAWLTASLKAAPPAQVVRAELHPRQPRRPQSADASLAALVRKTAHEPMETKRSPTALLTKAGRGRRSTPSDGLPLTLIALASYRDSVNSFVRRRLLATAKVLVDQGVFPKPWLLAKACGLRQQTLEQSDYKPAHAIAEFFKPGAESS